MKKDAIKKCNISVKWQFRPVSGIIQHSELTNTETYSNVNELRPTKASPRRHFNLFAFNNLQISKTCLKSLKKSGF